MGVMTKMRESTAVVLWVVVFAFGGLWVLQDSGAFENIGMGQQRHIAVVNGAPISVQDFNEAFEQRRRAYEQQTGQPASPAVRDQIADQVYQELVDDMLREREMDRLGITVSDIEVRNMVLGPRPDPLVAQLFPDGEGGVDRARVIALFNDPETFQQIYGVDPLVLENYLRAKRRVEKLSLLMESSIRVTDAEIREEYLRRHRRASADFVALRYADVPDAQVEVADRDLRRFYDANRQEFHRPRTVTLEYVTMDQRPSAADTAAALQQLGQLRNEFAAADDDSLFVAQRFSQIPYTGRYLSPGEIPADLASVIYDDLTVGRIVGPVAAEGYGMLAKINSVRPTEQTAVRARHILIGQRGEPADQRAAQLARAEELVQAIEAGDISFADAARQYSQDPGSAERGGDLGYFTRGRMVPAFEEAAFGASPGQVVGPVETEFGYHIIQVNARANHEVRLAIVAHEVTLTSITLRELRDRIEDVKVYSETGSNFQDEAARAGLQVQRVTVEADQQVIPDLGANRQIRRFVERTRPGRTSDVIDTGDAFVYLRTVDVQREGYRPFDEVRAEIEPRVRLERKREIQIERLRQAVREHGFEGLPETLDVPLRTAASVQFNNPMIPNIGREPRFVGTALGLREGQTSGVVAGENAAFVLVVRSSNMVDPTQMSGTERESIRNALTTRKRDSVIAEWMETLRDQAEIEDHRAQVLL
jgi:peptidyl-prolyl cis-trans isomerase D